MTNRQTVDLKSLEKVRDIIKKETSIFIPDDKISLLTARLGRRMRSLGHKNVKDYVAALSNGSDQDELNKMISAITTNHTMFNREDHHFDILLDLAEKHCQDNRSTFNIWCAGCSTGQEPYSILMRLAERRPFLEKSVCIRASDIDENAIEKAKYGEYSETEVAGVTKGQLSKFFRNSPKGFSVIDELKAQVKFDRVNLLKTASQKEHYNAIFCRNVAIYFDRPTQNALWEEMTRKLEKSGTLFIGHSETLPVSVRKYYSHAGATAYRLIDNRC